MKIVLALRDYINHTTDEGHQLQLALAHAGWTLAGKGLEIDCTDVAQIVERYKPDRIFVSDRRDWDAASEGAYDKSASFTNIACLRDRPDIFKVMVLKDAGTSLEQQRGYAEELRPDALAVYYHPSCVETFSPWARQYPLIRMYHTIDPWVLQPINAWPARRKRAVVSGAMNIDIYPLRFRVAKNHVKIGADIIYHPGYGNRKSHTREYLQQLTNYHVHVACSSKFGFALRKIIESIACGCLVLTDLPRIDQMPAIEPGIFRIDTGADVDTVQRTISEMEASWQLRRMIDLSLACCDFYDYRVQGRRLDAAIDRAMHERSAPRRVCSPA